MRNMLGQTAGRPLFDLVREQPEGVSHLAFVAHENRPPQHVSQRHSESHEACRKISDVRPGRPDMKRCATHSALRCATWPTKNETMCDSFSSPAHAGGLGGQSRQHDPPSGPTSAPARKWLGARCGPSALPLCAGATSTAAPMSPPPAGCGSPTGLRVWLLAVCWCVGWLCLVVCWLAVCLFALLAGCVWWFASWLCVGLHWWTQVQPQEELHHLILRQPRHQRLRRCQVAWASSRPGPSDDHVRQA